MSELIAATYIVLSAITAIFIIALGMSLSRGIEKL